MAIKSKSKNLVEVHTFAALGDAHPGETLADSIHSYMDAKAADGWEVVSVMPLSAPEYLFVFKAV